jgi:phosphopantetheine adenylyltransferase
MNNIINYSFGFLEGVDRGKKIFFDKLGTGAIQALAQYVDVQARANPRALHHVYEWSKPGNPAARLFDLNFIESSGLSFKLDYQLLESKSYVPNKKSGKRYKFVEKASVMESGMPVTIAPKSSKRLVFEIDGIKVCCELIVNENGMSLFIRTSKMLMYNIAQHDERAFVVRQLLFRKTYIKKLTKYTLKDYETVIKHMNKDINDMKFDTINGVFITPQIKHPKEVPHVSSNLEILNSVPCSSNSEECSVCLELTKTTTSCGHKVCVSCWCQIKPKGRELPCPICRADLFQSKKIGIIDSRVEADVADNEDDNDDSDDDSDYDSDDDSYDDILDGVDDSDIQYAQFPEPIEFPSVRQNSIMDMN